MFKLQVLLRVSCDVLCFRHFVILCGRKAIHDALVLKSTDFADRPEFFTQTSVNARRRGRVFLSTLGNTAE